MTQNQIAFQNLKENVRHNLATENISSTSNAINREHYIRADQAALSQAESARRNADTNAYNASINYMNAVSNQEQANAALMNAATNQRNAATNEVNARANVQNAHTNARNAETQARSVDIQGSIAPSTIEANYGKAEQSRASAFKNKVDAYGDHPVAASLVATGATDKLVKAGTSIVGGISNFFTSKGEPLPNSLVFGTVEKKLPKTKYAKRAGGGRYNEKTGKLELAGPNVKYD